MYNDWSREDLINKIKRLQNELDDEKAKHRKIGEEMAHLQFRVDNELEPRIAAEKRRYDNWVTNPERGR